MRRSRQLTEDNKGALALTHRHLHGRQVRARRDVPSEPLTGASTIICRKKPCKDATWPGITADGGITCEVDPDFLEHARREVCERPELPWDD